LIVVSDTSPVLNLSVIGQLELLRALYGTIVIPPTVAQELKRNQFDPETTEWIIVQVPKDHGAVQLLYQMLDPGEWRWCTNPVTDKLGACGVALPDPL
jgi:predicted nucleic acid-binding protein